MYNYFTFLLRYGYCFEKTKGMKDEHAGLGLGVYDSNVMNYFFKIIKDSL